MTSARLVADLREDEGEVLHVYQDHLGYWTIGVGILVDKRNGGGLRKEESEFILMNRIRLKEQELLKRLPWFGAMDDARQNALVNMAFQMGVDGLLGFKNSLRYIEAGDWVKAGQNLRKSLWFAQTPNRAERVIRQIETGQHRGT